RGADEPLRLVHLALARAGRDEHVGDDGHLVGAVVAHLRLFERADAEDREHRPVGRELLQVEVVGTGDGGNGQGHVVPLSAVSVRTDLLMYWPVLRAGRVGLCWGTTPTVRAFGCTVKHSVRLDRHSHA